MNIKAVIAFVKDQVSPLFDPEFHKLAGVGLAALGVSSGAQSAAGFRELVVGAAYAAFIHLTQKTPVK